MKSVIVFVFIVVSTLSVCRSADNDILISDTNLYVSKVNNLNIRETPDLMGKVIGRLMSYEEVEFINEKSNHVTTVDVDDEMIEAAWVKIKTKNGLIGWVWEGFLARVKKLHDTTHAVTFKFPDFFVYDLGEREECKTEIVLYYYRVDINTLEHGEGHPGFHYYESSLQDKRALEKGITPRGKLYTIGSNRFAFSFLYQSPFSENIWFNYYTIFYEGNTQFRVSAFIPRLLMARAMPRNFKLYVDSSELEYDILPKINDKQLKDFLKENISGNDRSRDTEEQFWKILKTIRYYPKGYHSSVLDHHESVFHNCSIDSIELKGAARDWYYGYHYILRTLKVGK